MPGHSLDHFGLSFHHFGLAVTEPSLALKFLGGLGYRAGQAVFDPLQGVNLLMCEHDVMPAVEVVYSAGKKSPLDEMLSRQAQGFVYHLCYVSDDPAASLARMEAAGLDLFEVSEEKAAVLFGGRPVSFHMVSGVGLIEIIGPGRK